jgi:hypothetical protein
MSIRQEEINSVIKLSPLQRYEYFVKKVSDFEKVYSIKERDEWFISEGRNNKFFMLWSASEFAKLFIKDRWEQCTVESIKLSEFIEILIPLAESRNILFSVFGVNGKSGFVVDSKELFRDLTNEIENYL